MIEIGNFTDPFTAEYLSPAEGLRLLDYVGYQAVGMIGMIGGGTIEYGDKRKKEKPRPKIRGSKFKRSPPPKRR